MMTIPYTLLVFDFKLIYSDIFFTYRICSIVNVCEDFIHFATTQYSYLKK